MLYSFIIIFQLHTNTPGISISEEEISQALNTEFETTNAEIPFNPRLYHGDIILPNVDTLIGLYDVS